MSWNLLIYKPGDSPQRNRPLGDLDSVATAFTAAFIGLEWTNPTEAEWPVKGGFRLELKMEDSLVQDAYTHGGFHHLRRFATLCQREGWRMADAQAEEDIDLEDPLKWFAGRDG